MSLCESCTKIGHRCCCSADGTCSEYSPVQTSTLEWQVFYHNFNANQIQPFNIFDHWKFNEDVTSDLRRCSNKVDFAAKLRSHLFYYFCSKCEWEIVIGPWAGSREKCEIKVDVYGQVMLNWRAFLDYVWSSKRSRR